MITDANALDRVLNQLQLTPTTRRTIKETAGESGSISLHALLNLLDQAATEQAGGVPAGKVAGAEVRALLASLTPAGGEGAGLQGAPPDTYPAEIDLEGLRRLLRAMIPTNGPPEGGPMVRERDRQGSVSAVGNFQTTGYTLTEDRGDAARPETAATDSLIPSFVREENRHASGAHAVPLVDRPQEPRGQDFLPAITPGAPNSAQANLQSASILRENGGDNAHNTVGLSTQEWTQGDAVAPPGSPHREPMVRQGETPHPPAGTGVEPSPATAPNQAPSVQLAAEYGDESLEDLMQRAPHGGAKGSVDSADITLETPARGWDTASRIPVARGQGHEGLAPPADSVADGSSQEASSSPFQQPSQGGSNLGGDHPEAYGDADGHLSRENGWDHTADFPSQIDHWPASGPRAPSAGWAQPSKALAPHPPSAMALAGLGGGSSPARSTAELMLELEVQDLGKLLMHVKTNHNEVATHILTDNQQVQELLQRGVPLLRQELESQGLTLGQLLIDLRQGKQERYPLLERGYRISRSAASGALEATEAAASRPPAVVTSRHGSGHWVNLVA